MYYNFKITVMKKRNLLWSMLATTLVGLLSVGFVSCDDDDEDTGNTSSTWEKGTWKLSQLQAYQNGVWVLPHEDYDYEAKNDHDASMPGFIFDGKGKAQILHWECYGEYPDYTYKLEAQDPGVSNKYTKTGDELIIDLGTIYAYGQTVETSGAETIRLTYDRKDNVLAIEASKDGMRARLTYKKQ